MPASSPSAASFSRALTSSSVVSRATSKTMSVSEALASGTRTAWPFSLPVSSGKMAMIALAEPVVVGIRLIPQARARRRSLWGASRITWVLVMSWMVVMEPWRMPRFSWITLTTGARQLVVQLAAVTIRCRAGPGRVEEVVVDPHHQIEHALVLHRGAHYHALDPLVEVGLEPVGGLHLAGGLDHHVTAGPVGGLDLAVCREGDAPSGHRQGGVVRRDIIAAAGPLAVHRVELQQVGEGGGVTAGVVDLHELEVRVRPAGAQRQAADAAEAIDADPDRHGKLLGCGRVHARVLWGTAKISGKSYMKRDDSSMTAALPIEARLDAIQAALAGHPRALLVAEPGAGKTTRVPLALLEAPWAREGRLLLLEPRRVAARLAAGFMAETLGESVGETVGYRMRGESRVGPHTRLEVVTQGVLTRMLQEDPLLEGVAGILFDEFHERSLEADLGLALALDAQSVRDDLRLLVMSATLDVEALLGVLGKGTPVIDCPGRTFPVATRYRALNAREEAAPQQARALLDAMGQQEGDALVILPGVAEIRRLARELSNRSPKLAVMELHGRLPLEAQRRALRPDPERRRRVVLATAIAESSVTVDGVRLVMDAGQERVPVFQPRSGLTRLETRRVNRASADQRRGRAGRQGPGLCLRLWAEEQPLVPHGEPEMRQADLAPLAFELARWGVTDPGSLAWVTPPPAAALSAGRELLGRLGLLDAEHHLSELGRRAARWPTHPRLAAMLERARALDALPLACALVALLEGRGLDDERDLEQALQARLKAPREHRQWQRRRAAGPYR